MKIPESRTPHLVIGWITGATILFGIIKESWPVIVFGMGVSIFTFINIYRDEGYEI